MSSDMAHSLKPMSRPFIPIIAPRNSTFLLLEKEGDFDLPIIILSYSYVIYFCAGVLGGNSPTYFSPPIYIAQIF